MPLDGREGLAEALVGLAFVVACVTFATAAPATEPASLPLAVTLLVTYAAVSRIEYHLGTGYTAPTELVLVPMLFALPPFLVPPMVAAGHVLAKLPDLLAGRTHPERLLLNVGDSWHAFGPALVFALAGVDGPSWGDWPVYAGALGAQLGLDLVVSATRERFGGEARLREQLPLIAWVYGLDALLAPIGLLAAFAAEGHPYAFLLLLPFAALFAIFTRERQAHIDDARELSRAYQGTARILAELLEDTSEYTGGHSRDLVSLATEVGAHLRLDEDDLRELELVALLHDIGKIAIPSAILEKPAALTDVEWALMKRHTIEGQRILDQVGGMLTDVGVGVRASHERWDGRGYPDGLAAGEIPLSARIVSCCDAFHAMTNDRPYRSARPIEEAVEELGACAGGQFDPAVVRAFVTILGATCAPQPESGADAGTTAVGPTACGSPHGAHSRQSAPFFGTEARHIAVVAEATRGLAQTNDRETARGAICEAALRVTGAAAAALLEPHVDGRMRLTARAGTSSCIDFEPLPFELPERLTGPHFTADPRSGSTLPPGLLHQPVGVSCHLEPVVHEGVQLGAVAVVWREHLDRLPEPAAATMGLLAAEAAVALERTALVARLQAALRTDELTGVLKRGAWEQELRREISRASREGRSLCVVMLDVDRFKHFNDRHGHLAGDELLKGSVRAWRGELRLADQVGRYGGDEFIVLLPGCQMEHGRALIERLRAATAAGQTCSCGIAEWDGSESPERLVGRADAALLQAKDRGRSRVGEGV